MATDPRDWQDNPVLTPYSPPYSAPAKPRKPSATLERLILELGLRYRPAARDQLEGHQAKIAALIADLIDVPTGPLEQACRAWVARSPYMPKASDLIEMAQEAVAPRQSAMSVQAMCDQRNANIERNKTGKPENRIEWYVAGSREDPVMRLGYVNSRPDGPPYCTPAEAREILREHPSSFARAILASIEARDA